MLFNIVNEKITKGKYLILNNPAVLIDRRNKFVCGLGEKESLDKYVNSLTKKDFDFSIKCLVISFEDSINKGFFTIEQVKTMLNALNCTVQVEEIIDCLLLNKTDRLCLLLDELNTLGY